MGIITEENIMDSDIKNVFGELKKLNPYKHTNESYNWWLKCKLEREGIVVNDPTKNVNIVPLICKSDSKLKPQEKYIEELLKVEDGFTEDIIVEPLSREEFIELEKKEIMLEWARLINEFENEYK